MTTKASSSSKYFASNSHDGENVTSKRKRAAKPARRAPVSRAADLEKSDTLGSDGSPVTDSAKCVRPVRGKRKSVESVKETVKRETRKKRVESEVQSKTEINYVSVSGELQPFCSTVQSCDESYSFAAEALDDENLSTSSSDVEWEDVEGRIFGSIKL